MAMALTNITSVDDQFEALSPRTMQKNLRPSIEEVIGFNFGRGSTLLGNNSPYRVNEAAMVAGRHYGQYLPTCLRLDTVDYRKLSGLGLANWALYWTYCTYVYLLP